MHEEHCDADNVRRRKKKWKKKTKQNSILRGRAGSEVKKASILAVVQCVRADTFGVVSQHVIRDVCSAWCGIEKPGLTSVAANLCSQVRGIKWTLS